MKFFLAVPTYIGDAPYVLTIKRKVCPHFNRLCPSLESLDTLFFLHLYSMFQFIDVVFGEAIIMGFI